MNFHFTQAFFATDTKYMAPENKLIMAVPVNSCDTWIFVHAYAKSTRTFRVAIVVGESRIVAWLEGEFVWEPHKSAKPFLTEVGFAYIKALVLDTPPPLHRLDAIEL